MKTSTRFAVAIAIVAACGGQVIDRSGGSGGAARPQPAAGTGGVWTTPQPAPGTGAWYATGGYPNTGGYPATGGWDTSGGDGALNTGGYWNTGGVPCCGTLWASPNVETACPGIATPPAVVKWVDDFESGANVFDPLIVPCWAVFSDVEETITGGQGPIPLGTPLAGWGSHDPASMTGMRMQGYVSSNLVAPKANSWGAQWQYETDAGTYPVKRPVMNLSAYTGIVVWARLAGVPGKGNMAVAFPTPQTTYWPTGGDGTCTDGGAGSMSVCTVHFQAPAKVTKTCWSPFNIPFSTLKVPYGSVPTGEFDKAHVFGVELQFSAWATLIKANWPVDVIVDDVYFY